MPYDGYWISICQTEKYFFFEYHGKVYNLRQLQKYIIGTFLNVNKLRQTENAL